ncbi:MAG: hypothetical protein KGO93_08665 [Cyanobacteria bacterium REEB446]|nr:hypothetical protein [Cyanobacteria bacterium REEB446]
MDLSVITGSFNGLTDIQKKAFEKSIKEADVNLDNVLDKKEFTEATEKFSKTDEFKSLSAENKKLFTEKLDADTIWGQQGASSVINYDGNKLQAEYYEKAKGKDGKPLVTREQLEYAKKNGFGDVNGDGKITGNELKVADINGDKKIDSKDGDLNKDGLVNKDDRGVDLRSDKSNNNGSGGGFDFKKFAEYFQKIIEIWAPQAAVKIPVPAPKTS